MTFSAVLARAQLLGIAALTLAIFFLVELAGETLVPLLEFRRDAIAQGEIWRLISGNFTHFGGYHTLMNAAGLAALVVVLFWYIPAAWFAAGVVLIPLAVGISLFLLTDDIEIYRGFSGANYGLLAMGLLLVFPQQKLLYGFAYCILLGKIFYEQLPGYDVDYLRGQIGVPVAIEAHLAGFCSGTMIGLSALIRHRLKGRASNQQA